MKINEYIKSKTIYFIITLLVVITLSVTSSFAFFNNSNSINVNDLEVSYKTNKKNSLYLEKTIDITNNTDTSKTYYVYASSLEDSTTISLDKIMYSINDGIDSYLKYNNNGSIYYGVLDSNESITLKVKFWVSYDLLENSDQGKTLTIDLNVQ